MAITEKQRAERINYLGSSDAAAVLGLNPWKTALQVWAEKTGQIPSPDPKNPLAIEVGTELEDLCAKLFERRTGKKVQRVTQTVFHPKHKFIAANLDRRVVGEDALLECKITGAWNKGWSGEDDDMPQEVLVQVLHQMACSGKKVGYAACLIGGTKDFRWKQIAWNDEVIKSIVSREVQFWTKFVVPKVMPAVTKGDSDTISQLFPSADDGLEIGLDEGANKTLDNLDAMKKDIGVLRGQIDRAQNELKVLLGEAAIGRTDRYLVKWKNISKKEFTTPAQKYRMLTYSTIKKEAA